MYINKEATYINCVKMVMAMEDVPGMPTFPQWSCCKIIIYTVNEKSVQFMQVYEEIKQVTLSKVMGTCNTYK